MRTTSSDGSRHVLRSVLLIAPSSVLSCLVTLWIVDPASPVPSPPASVDTVRLVERIDDLRRRVDAGFRSRGFVSPEPVEERQPLTLVDPSSEELSVIVNRLERLLAAFSSGAGGGRSPVQRNVPINWSELDSLRALRESNREAARQSVTLLTPAEVIARFGFPSHVQAVQRSQSHLGDMIWTYDRVRRDGGMQRASFHFQGGYVIDS